MRWPWQRSERRESYTDALVSLIRQHVTGGESPAGRQGATAIAGAVAELWANALGAAKVEGGPLAQAAITPEILALVGRELIQQGEIVLVFELPPEFVPASSWTVWSDGPSRSSWHYQATITDPSKIHTMRVPRSQVVHLQWAARVTERWRSRSPLAGLTGDLAAGLEQRAAEEAGAPSGYVLGADVGPEEGDFDGLVADVADARGATVLARRLQDGTADWVSKRIGADPPASLVELRRDVQVSLAMAGLVPPPLIVPGSDASAAREAYRRWVHAAVGPVAVRAAHEFSRVLEEEVTLDLSSLHAADIAGRTRGAKQLVEAGEDLEDAKETVGL